VVAAPALLLRPGEPADRGFVRGLAEESFSIYGDYGRLLLEWLDTPGVEVTIAEEDGAAVGLTLLAFVPDPDRRGAWLADLLAIAVSPLARGRGLGRRLLASAAERAREASRGWPVHALRLSVAEENARARRLFEAAGFRYRGAESGYYPRGQRALHMRLVL
jgi:ribosomal-protein-alanine N-acetyltransferase